MPLDTLADSNLPEITRKELAEYCGREVEFRRPDGIAIRGTLFQPKHDGELFVHLGYFAKIGSTIASLYKGQTLICGNEAYKLGKGF